MKKERTSVWKKILVTFLVLFTIAGFFISGFGAGVSRLRKLADNLMLVEASSAWNKPYETSAAPVYGPSPCEDDYDVKYAVSIYGINQDVGESGDTLGVTFGPATGENYVHSYKYCPGTDASINPGNCMHWMTWDEIIEVAKTNPESLRLCLENGCTHSVAVKFTDETIKGTSYAGQMDDGDGAAVLYNSISSNYRKWNNSNYNYGGWAASRARAVLNGADEYTADGADVNNMGGKLSSISATSNYAGTDMNGFTTEQALISTFPTELQEAIAPKAVVADTKYNDYTATDYTATTYDKLWYFSTMEIRTDTVGGRYERSNEGLIGDNPYYDRANVFCINSSSIAKLKGFNDAGSANRWWLRSANRSYNDVVYSIYSSGDWSRDFASYAYYSVAPGFCIN